MYFNDSNKTYVLLDIEGNSSKEIDQRRITQFAAIVFKDGKFEELSWKNRNVNYINSYVQKLNKITLQDCKSHGLSERNLVLRIHDLLSKADYIYAYGCDFDKNIIKIMFEKYELKQLEIPWYDVIEDVKKYLNPSKNKLSIAASEYGFIETSYHDAMTDCKATLYLMKTIEQIREICK